jgi:muconolactone delta-isomerase
VSQRSFVVRVSETTTRVVVEDVRTREKAVAENLSAVGDQIARWLGDGTVQPASAKEEGVDA